MVQGQDKLHDCIIAIFILPGRNELNHWIDLEEICKAHHNSNVNIQYLFIPEFTLKKNIVQEQGHFVYENYKSKEVRDRTFKRHPRRQPRSQWMPRYNLYTPAVNKGDSTIG